MIICITPNVAIDRTMIVPGYADGGVFRPQEEIVVAGGKGLNVVRAIKTLGQQSISTGFLAGHSGKYAEQLLQDEGLDAEWAWLETGETRTCFILVDENTQQTTVVNNRGPETTGLDWQHLQDTVLSLSSDHRYVCISGSLPVTDSLDVFVSLLQNLVRNGKQVWLDTSGAVLEAAIAVPSINLKINQEEAGELTGQQIETVADAVEAANYLHKRVSGTIVITMGKNGAILLNSQKKIFAAAPSVEVVSAVGSGDSFFAGLLASLDEGMSCAVAMKRAIAAGAANAMSIGGAQFSYDLVQQLERQVTIENL